MKKRATHYWTLPEIRILLDHYEQKGPDYCAAVLQAKGFHRSVHSTNQKANKIGLHYKGPALGRFKKGHIPPNKGRKMSPEQYEMLRNTMFKPGARPDNRVPIGQETIRSDGYTYVKVAEKVWRFKHILLWEKFFGPVPEGHIISFRDGNPQNFDVSNLECITRKESLSRNRFGAGPSEYSLISGRAARMRLKARGIGRRAIRANPELLELAKSETLLKLKTRKRHGHHSNNTPA